LTGYYSSHAVLVDCLYKLTSGAATHILSSLMLCYHYKTYKFSNKEGAIDHVSQRKVLVAKLHNEFNGKADMVK
jgi:hypothetical protein